MSTNLLIFLSPVVGLLVVRLLGPWRPLSAFAAAAIGAVASIAAYSVWLDHRMARLLEAPPGSRNALFVHVEPTLGGRAFALAMIVLIAALATALCLCVQFLVTRRSGGPPAV